LVWKFFEGQKLKEVDRLKDDFLSRTSHELRTPLNGIIGIAHSLIDGATGQLPPNTNENLTMIAASGKRLHLLVNDILDSSSLRAGKLKLHKKPVDLHTLTDIICMLSKPLTGSKEIQLINDIKPGEFIVDADEDRLQQIMFNLVGNAVKFTDAGEVRVSTVINGRVLHVRVSDTGIGIPREKFKRIFESFEQVQGAADRAYGGTGLGLSIVKQLVELHGGKIWVESIVGRGTTFTFTLPPWEGNIEKPVPGMPPGAIPPGEAPAMQLTGSPGETAGRIRILVVEDDPVNLQVVLNFLNPVLYAVTPVSDGPQALAVLGRGEIFDLVLLDIMMPRMSGYEVCRKIRERFQPDELPVIFLTAKTQTADLETSMSAGGNDFITKPFEKENLLSCIDKHLRKAQREKIEKPDLEIPGQENGPVKPGDNISRDNLLRLLRGIDVESGLKRLDNRDKAFIDTLIVFANEYREVMKQIRSSLFSDTGEKFLLMVHKLKGASGIISAKGVHAAAAELHHAIEENRDKNDLERLAGKLDEEITPVLDSILAVKAEISKTKISIPAGEIKDPDLEAVQPLVMKLAGLLEAGDFQSVQPAGELMTHLVYTHAAEDARALKDQIESTRFRDARETLDKIIHTLGIKI
jgi:CheY-like chemotaxis protein/HPt (histidine-containing phosphotransfer) domain-containing protein/two-component sensor histidine kinase